MAPVLRDRNVEYTRRMKHEFFSGDMWSERVDELFRLVQRFISSAWTRSSDSDTSR
jgi:hypothetical protein